MLEFYSDNVQGIKVIINSKSDSFIRCNSCLTQNFCICRIRGSK